MGQTSSNLGSELVITLIVDEAEWVLVSYKEPRNPFHFLVTQPGSQLSKEEASSHDEVFI